MMSFLTDELAASASSVDAALDNNNTGYVPTFDASVQSNGLPPQTVAFVDSAIANIDSLLQSLEADRVVVVNSSSDGVTQISQTLSQYEDLASVQIFSHGMAGTLALGDVRLRDRNLDAYTDELTEWGRAIRASGDVLLYGCDVAAGEVGVDFVTELGSIIGADVAASTNLTGIGGDWVLEVSTGNIEASMLLNTAASDGFSGTLNLLNNGDFESGLAPWSWWGGFRDGEQTSSSQASSGQRSLRLSSGQSGVGQMVAGSEGTTYRLSGQARSSSGGYSTFGLKFFDTNGVELSRLDIGSINNSDWQSFGLEGTAPAGTALVQAFGFKWDENGDTFIDNVSIVAENSAPIIPEPIIPEVVTPPTAPQPIDSPTEDDLGPTPIVAPPSNPSGNKVSVFLLGGQSNMVGLGRNYELSNDLLSPNDGVKIWQESSRSFISLQPGFSDPYSGSGPEFGPELTFGRGIAGYNGNDVYLIKHATGSTNLVNDWDPDGAYNREYDTFVARVDAALADLRGQGIEYNVEGMLWMQGEADSYNEYSANLYQNNLTELVGNMRDRYGSQLKFAVGELHPNFNTAYDDTVRAAQYNVVNSDSRTLLVDTDGFGLYSDQVHYNTSGQLDLGYRFASTLRNS